MEDYDFNLATYITEALLFGPALEGLRREIGKLLVTMNSQYLFEKPTVRGNAVHYIREAERCSSGFGGCVGVAEYSVA